MAAATLRRARIDERALRELVGYHCRRASLAVLEHSARPMSAARLGRTGFSALLLLHRNPGASSRQICVALGVQPPNLVALVASLEERGLVERRPDPGDARALGLHLTAAGRRLAARVERAVLRAERRATSMLTDADRDLLNLLLLRICGEPQCGPLPSSD